MGHAEMLLAVAGLDQLQVTERVKILSGGDWSSFPPRERVLFFFSRKMSRSPGEVSAADVAEMVRHWGLERTQDWIFHISWCNFMTRVADAFQIPLETDNVFLPPDQPAKTEKSG